MPVDSCHGGLQYLGQVNLLFNKHGYNVVAGRENISMGDFHLDFRMVTLELQVFYHGLVEFYEVLCN